MLKLVDIDTCIKIAITQSYLGYLEKVMSYENKSLEFKGQIENINTMVETDYDGANTFKEVQLLVILVHYVNPSSPSPISEDGWFSPGSRWFCDVSSGERATSQDQQSIHFGD